jgi:hypothetical protein
MTFSNLVSGLKDKIINTYEVASIAKAKVQNTLTLGLAGAIIPSIKEKANTPIIANVENKNVKAALEFVANNPVASAGVIAGVSTAVTNPTAIGKAIGSLSTKSKIALGVSTAIAGPTVVQLVANNPATALSVAEGFTPESLVEFGQQLGDVRSASDLVELAKDRPITTGALAIGGLYLTSGALLAGVKTVSSLLVNKSIKDAADATADYYQDLPKTNPDSTKEIPTIPSIPNATSPYTPDITNTSTPTGKATDTSLPSPSDAPVIPVGTKSISKAKKRKSKRAVMQYPRPTNIRINNILAGKFIY